MLICCFRRAIIHGSKARPRSEEVLNPAEQQAKTIQNLGIGTLSRCPKIIAPAAAQGSATNMNSLSPKDS